MTKIFKTFRLYIKKYLEGFPSREEFYTIKKFPHNIESIIHIYFLFSYIRFFISFLSIGYSIIGYIHNYSWLYIIILFLLGIFSYNHDFLRILTNKHDFLLYIYKKHNLKNEKGI